MIKFKPLTLPEEWIWFKSRARVILCEDMKGIVAYDTHGNRIVGCCVADSFGPDNCNVHIAIDNPMVIRRGLLNEVAEWLFIQCGRTRIFGLVPSNNEKARRFDEHIGFTEIARVPNAVSEGVDYIVLEMHKDNCPWLTENAEAA